jgi:enoyl-CoA hydratase
MGNLIFEKQSSHIGILKINRPEVLNAINRATLEEMLDFLRNKSKQEDCRALIITGAGEKSFIAGADIKEMREMSNTEMLQFTELGQEVTQAISRVPLLTIAAVNGYALGGGFEMALACDFIYASKNAKFGLPEVSLGIIPGFGGTQRLSRAIGTRQAKELIMSGRTFTAEEAYARGIVNQICETETLIKDCSVVASEIIRHSHFAIVQAKHAIDAGYHLSMAEALELERNMCAVCFATEECSEGMTAFLERHHKG